MKGETALHIVGLDLTDLLSGTCQFIDGGGNY